MRVVLAHVQRLIALGLLLAVVAGIALAIRLDSWLVALAAPAVVTVVYSGVLANEFVLLWRTYRRGDSMKPRFAQLILAWIRETSGAPRVFLWRQPFRSQVEVDFVSDTDAGRRGVLLVHGFFCNRGVWNHWMARLRANDTPFIAIDLEPLFASIDSYAVQVAAAMDRLEAATHLTPIVVAHSMGGLAARACFAGARERPPHRLVTIATPHAGTRMAARGMGANIRQMRIASEWLLALGTRESPALRERTTCFWSHCDNIVMPTRNATLAGADNRHLVATPHVQMVDHPDVFEAVLEMIASDEAVRMSI